MKIKETKISLIDSGSLAGMPAFFISLADDSEEGVVKGVDDLIKEVQESTVRYVVLKGGVASQKEEASVLLAGIEDLYRRTVIESDGSLPPDLEADLYSFLLKPRGAWPAENINACIAAGGIAELRIEMEDEIDLRETLIALANHDLPRSMIFFLPAGEDLESYRDNAAFLQNECQKYGFRLGGRLKFLLEE